MSGILGLLDLGSLAGLMGTAAAVILAAFAWYFKGRKSGRESTAVDVMKRVQDGQSAVSEGRASGETPAERVRRNDGQWQ